MLRCWFLGQVLVAVVTGTRSPYVAVPIECDGSRTHAMTRWHRLGNQLEWRTVDGFSREPCVQVRRIDQGPHAIRRVRLAGTITYRDGSECVFRDRHWHAMRTDRDTTVVTTIVVAHLDADGQVTALEARTAQ